MSDKYIIRAAVAEDFDTWLRLWKGYLDFYKIELDDQLLKTSWQRLTDEKTPEMGALLSLTEDGRGAGLLHYVTHHITWASAPVCYLDDLFVDPDARGGGVARGLIERLTEMGHENQWHRLYWHTARDNVPAQILYNKMAERTGWVRYDLDLE